MMLYDNLRFLDQAPGLVNWRMEFSNWESFLLEGQVPGPEDLIKMAELTGLPVDHLLRKNLRDIHGKARSRKPGLILLDVDGTLSDGGMYYGEGGDQLKKFNVKDGLIIYRLIRRQKVEFGLISSGFTGNIMQNRAATLGITRIYHGTRPKVEVIDEWLAEMSLTWEDLAYVGDDLNDLEVIQKAGISACPADAVWRVQQAADVVLKRGGGQGCVREFLEEVLGYEV